MALPPNVTFSFLPLSSPLVTKKGPLGTKTDLERKTFLFPSLSHSYKENPSHERSPLCRLGDYHGKNTETKALVYCLTTHTITEAIEKQLGSTDAPYS